MQQTLKEKGWFAATRCPGIFRYHFCTLGKIVAWVLGVTCASGLLFLLLPLIFPTMDISMRGGITANLSQAILFAMICGIIAAGRSTRFLLRFGTPRFSVWLCTVLSLMGAMFALLLGSLAVSALHSYLALALPQSQSVTQYFQTAGGLQVYQYDAAFLARSFLDTLSALPNYLLWLAEYVCIFYLLGCCLHRAKGLTLTILIGVPFAFIMLMIVPAVEDALTVAMSGDQAQITVAGAQWVIWMANAFRFIQREWPIIQLGIAVSSLPLSYLCMRGAKQP